MVGAASLVVHLDLETQLAGLAIARPSSCWRAYHTAVTNSLLPTVRTSTLAVSYTNIATTFILGKSL